MSCGVGGGERGGGRSSAFVSLLLRLAVERTSALGMHYARLRTRCAPTDDQMATEVTPASSSCGGAFRSARNRRLQVVNRVGVRGKRRRSSHRGYRDA